MQISCIHLCRKTLGCIQMHRYAPQPRIHGKPCWHTYLFPSSTTLRTAHCLNDCISLTDTPWLQKEICNKIFMNTTDTPLGVKIGQSPSIYKCLGFRVYLQVWSGGFPKTKISTHKYQEELTEWFYHFKQLLLLVFKWNLWHQYISPQTISLLGNVHAWDKCFKMQQKSHWYTHWKNQWKWWH